MKILVASVFCRHPQNRLWRQLQQQFVAQYTPTADYAVVLNGEDHTLYPKAHVIALNEAATKHLFSIRQIVEYFTQSNYDRLLLLDSDCWPIRENWVELLESLLDKRWYAAPVRFENYDTFPHPAAFYCKRDLLPQLDFGYASTVNLYGEPVNDIGCRMPTIIEGVQRWLPLVRTNRLNYHPLFAGIYGHLFYHHGCGSRGLGFRSRSYGIYNHIVQDHRKIYQEITMKLARQPWRFIEELTHGS